VTDNLSDKLHVRPEKSTIVFSILLALVFFAWYSMDKTLSIHSITTRRREAFYWLAVLVSFALGTASGDLMAERLGFGYAVSGMIIAGLIIITSLLWRKGMNPILGFWVVYIFTRPLGASIGDLLAQPTTERGLGLGTTKTSFIFLAAILAVVIFLTVTKIDTNKSATGSNEAPVRPGGLKQTLAFAGTLIAVGLVVYNVRTNSLANQAATATPATTVAAVTVTTTASAASTAVAKAGATPTTTAPATATSAPVAGAAAGAPKTKLGDLTALRAIAQDTLDKLNAGDQAGATKRVTDFETLWDKDQARLQPLDGKAWTAIDGKADTMLRQLRASSPNVTTEKAALTDILALLV
jgi:hypothetical protein